MDKPEFLAKLFFRYTRGELTASQRAALNTWRKESLRNEEIFLRMTDPEVMRQTSIDIEKSRKHVFQLMREKIPGLWQNRPKPNVISFRFSRAAAILLILVIGAGTYQFFYGGNRIHPGSYEANLTGPDGVAHALDDFHRGLMDGLSGVKIRKDDNGNRMYITVNDSTASRDKYFILSTTRGSYFSVLLPDNTRVYLNAQSSLRYPANFHQDTIRLFIDGEAFFEVRRDSSHPMIISVKPNDLQLSIFNGRFNVINYDYEPIDVTMLDGSAQILPAYKGESATYVSDGNHAVMMNGYLFITPNKEADEIIAWKKGRLLYNKRRLEDILPAIGRWYDVDFVYLGKIPQREFNLDLSRDAEISEVIKALQQQGLHISLTKRTIFVGA